MNSRDKGKRGERQWARFCNEYGYNVRRGVQYSGIEGEDCVNLPGIWQEVKWVERLNVREAMEQAIRDCKGRIPIVAHKKNNGEWLVTMRAADWLGELYREWEAGQCLDEPT